MNQVKFLRGYSSPDQISTFLSLNSFNSICFVGRSNVGKSSIINALFGKKTARTSKTPGRTQEINTFEFFRNDKKYLFYDLPGYGFANVPLYIKKQWNILLGRFFQDIPTNCLIINIQDARHPFQSSDQDFLDMIIKFPQHKILCLNKIDKLKKQKDRHMLDKILKTNMDQICWARQIFKVSAEKRTGLDQLKKAIEDFIDQDDFKIQK